MTTPQFALLISVSQAWRHASPSSRSSSFRYGAIPDQDLVAVEHPGLSGIRRTRVADLRALAELGMITLDETRGTFDLTASGIQAAEEYGPDFEVS